MTSRTITLFSERRETPHSASPAVASVLLHVAAIACLSYGVLHNPEVNNHALAERYTVRHLELRANETETQARPHSTIQFPGQYLQATGNLSKAGVPGHSAQSVSGAGAGQQLLIQPNALLRLQLKAEVPIPTVVLWMPGRNIPQTIVPPRQKLSAAESKPSLQAPNEELNLSDLGVSSSDVARQKLALSASTTSPLVVHGPSPAQLAPQSLSQNSAPPTPAAVMSLSPVRMNNGLMVLPEVNIGPGNRNAAPVGAQPAAAAKPPTADSSKTDAEAKAANPGSGAPTAKMSGPVSAAVSATSNSMERDGSVARIDLPKDGQFGAVVVGSWLEERYPETADLWSGRMAYTAYIHVGLAKSWILQYSLPRSADAAAGGNIARIEAPWPYTIVRPNIAPGTINADALMVHGYVNEAGRFENLAVAFPPDFAQSSFLLAALAQWQFRPARQNGQSARVEVLLIIPEVP